MRASHRRARAEEAAAAADAVAGNIGIDPQPGNFIPSSPARGHLARFHGTNGLSGQDARAPGCWDFVPDVKYRDQATRPRFRALTLRSLADSLGCGELAQVLHRPIRLIQL